MMDDDKSKEGPIFISLFPAYLSSVNNSARGTTQVKS